MSIAQEIINGTYKKDKKKKISEQIIEGTYVPVKPTLTSKKSNEIAPLTTTVEQPTIQTTIQPTVSQATSQNTTIGPTTTINDEKKKQLLLQYKNQNNKDVMFANTSLNAMSEKESKEFKEKVAKEEAKAQKKNEKFQKLPYVLKVVDQALQAPKDRISYILRQGGTGIYGGISGIAESATTEAANEVKKGGNESKLGQIVDVLNETVKLTNPTLSLSTPKVIKNNKKGNVLENIIGNVNNATTGAVNSIPGKSFIDELMQSVGAFSGNADVASDIVMSAGSKISEPYYKKQEELNEEGKKYGKSTQILGQASNVVGRMVPSIAATYATKNPNVGLATMGLSAKGSATTEALKRGAELDEAVKIGDTKGMVEIGTEMLTGGMNIFGKGALDDIVEKGIDKAVKNQVMNFLAKKGAGIGGEVVEELISDIADTYIDKGTVDPNAKYSLKDFGNTAVTTILSTLVLNALSGGYTPAAFRNNAIELQQNQAQQNQEQIQQNQPQIQQNMQQEQQNMQEEQQTAPEQENVNLKEKASQEINDAKISEIEKKEMLEALNNIETVTEEDMQAIRSTIAEINKNNMLPTKENYKESQERRQKYTQYKNDTSEYDSSAIKNVLEAIPENRNGKRTVKQWLKAADEIGKIIANESNENIEKIAYKSWFELEPNKNITRYDRETKSNASFQKFTSDEWINTINNAVNEARANNQVQEKTQLDQKQQIENSQKLIENNQKSVYNNTESESDINVGRRNEKQNEGNIQESGQWNSDRGGSERGATVELDAPTEAEKLTNYKEKLDIINNSKNNIQKVNTSQNMLDVYKDLGINLYGYNETQTNHDGLTHEGEVFINNASNVSKEVVGAHELIHALRQKGNEIYNDEIKPIIDDVANNDEYRYTLVEYLKNNNLSEGYLNDKYRKLLAEEVIGNVSSEVLAKYEENHYIGEENKAKLEKALMKITNGRKFIDDNQNSNTSSFSMPKEIAPIKNDVTNTIANETTKQKQEEADKKIAQILDKPITKQKEKSRAWAIAKANLIDKGIVFEELSKKTNNRELEGKWDATLSAESAAQYAINNPRYNFEDKQQKQISKGLNEIREEVGKNTSEFNKYMYNLLNIDRMTLESRYGIDNKPVFSNDITAEISQKIVDELEQKYPEFKKYAQDVYDYNNANKAELVKDGVISQELSDKLAEIYPHYVPIKRVDKNNLAINVPLDTNRTGINSPLARAKGGTSDINPLFETMAERTRQTYRAGARNSFGVELLNSLNTLQSQENADVENLIDNLGTEETDTELLKEGKNGKSPTFTVFDNGVKKTFEITQDMYEALKPMSKALRDFNNSNLSKVLRKIGNFRRGLLTEYNPLFSITNAFKDAQDALGNSQHAAKTYAKFPESTAQILSKGYWYKEYVQNGGESNTYFKDGEFVDESKNTGKVKKTLKMPLEGISKANNIIEMTPRLAEYIASREAGRSVQTSMLDAARVTTNFKAGGDITKTLNRNGATFLNASVQGFQQQVRNIQEANAKGLKGWAVLASKYAIAGIAPTMLMKALWGDDDDYEELQDYVKDNYYIVGKVGDTFIRIPKGRVAATAQKLVSNVTKYVKDGKLDVDSFSSNFWKDLVEDVEFGIDNVAPNNPIDNNILSPIIQAATGKTWYGEDLVPTRLQKKPAAEQTDESIDKFSTWLGEKTGISPYKINYLIDQYSGGVGDVVLPMLTTQAESGAETIGQKMIAPFVDKFSTNATMKSKYPGEFFEKLNKLEIQSNSDKATDEDTTNYKYFQEKSKEMSELYKEKRQIQSDSDLSDSEKFKQVKKVQSQINEIAKKALEDIAPVKQSGDSNTKTIGDTKYYKDTDGSWNKVSDKDLDKMGVSLDTYAKYKNDISEMKDKTNKDVTNKQKIEILLNKGYSNKDKKAIYSNSIGSQDELYSLIKNDIDINDYLKYKTQEFESDKEDDGTITGKKIDGSRKTKVIDYLNDTNMDYEQKLLLLGTQFSLSKSEKREIFDYVDDMSLNESDKLELLNKIKGFTIYKDGTVKW